MFWWKNPKRSKFGRWLDNEGITQVEFSEKSEVSRRTLTRICNEKEYIPSPQILRKIMNVVKKVDSSKHPKDFFDI